MQVCGYTPLKKYNNITCALNIFSAVHGKNFIIDKGQ
jgi:hypothetical protein